jgi:predicted nuclease of predicted toxin-antitoxin system
MTRPIVVRSEPTKALAKATFRVSGGTGCGRCPGRPRVRPQRPCRNVSCRQPSRPSHCAFSHGRQSVAEGCPCPEQCWAGVCSRLQCRATYGTDRSILDYAAANALVIVSADCDFGEMLGASRGATRPSVVLLRSADRLTSDEQAALLAANLPAAAVDLEAARSLPSREVGCGSGHCRSSPLTKAVRARDFRSGPRSLAGRSPTPSAALNSRREAVCPMTSSKPRRYQSRQPTVY